MFNVNAIENLTAPATIATQRLEAILAKFKDLHETRVESIKLAIELGADDDTLFAIAGAVRCSRKLTIILPAGRYEHLSRGRGWARQGSGSNAVWGERADVGYRVGPGKWVVGSTDGFNRKSSVNWTVKNINVGDQVWTVAN